MKGRIYKLLDTVESVLVLGTHSELGIAIVVLLSDIDNPSPRGTNGMLTYIFDNEGKQWQMLSVLSVEELDALKVHTHTSEVPETTIESIVTSPDMNMALKSMAHKIQVTRGPHGR